MRLEGFAAEIFGFQPASDSFSMTKRGGILTGSWSGIGRRSGIRQQAKPRGGAQPEECDGAPRGEGGSCHVKFSAKGGLSRGTPSALRKLPTRGFFWCERRRSAISKRNALLGLYTTKTQTIDFFLFICYIPRSFNLIINPPFKYPTPHS